MCPQKQINPPVAGGWAGTKEPPFEIVTYRCPPREIVGAKDVLDPVYLVILRQTGHFQRNVAFPRHAAVDLYHGVWAVQVSSPCARLKTSSWSVSSPVQR